MAQRSCDEQGVKQACLIDGAPNDLRWIHPNVKMITTSFDCRNPITIKDLKSSNLINEDVEGIIFKPVELDERPYSYEINRFMIFYKDILAKL